MKHTSCQGNGPEADCNFDKAVCRSSGVKAVGFDVNARKAVDERVVGSPLIFAKLHDAVTRRDREPVVVASARGNIIQKRMQAVERSSEKRPCESGQDLEP